MRTMVIESTADNTEFLVENRSLTRITNEKNNEREISRKKNLLLD